MNPQMLTLLRESRGYSGAQLAQLSGVPQPTLSRIENGLAVPDEERLQRIADALEYPVSAFSWTDPIYGFGSAAFYHRKQQTLPQTALRRIQAQVNLTRMRLDRLLRSIDIERRYPLPVLHVEDYGSPSEVARAVRALWKMPIGPVQNIMAAVESAGIVVLHADFQSPKISAVSIDHIGVYPALMILNSNLTGDRERFTVAHELGHLVMHDELTTSEEAEAEADAFAAEFLMPAAEIRAQLRNITLQRAAQLKVVWRVAMSAIIRRARDLGLIDDRRYKSLNVSISQKGWRKAEPVEVGRDEPSVVSSLLGIHLGEHGYSVEELANVVALRPAEFTARFGVAERPTGSVPRSRLRALN